MENSLKFYRDLLGLKIVRDMNEQELRIQQLEQQQWFDRRSSECMAGLDEWNYYASTYSEQQKNKRLDQEGIECLRQLMHEWATPEQIAQWEESIKTDQYTSSYSNCDLTDTDKLFQDSLMQQLSSTTNPAETKSIITQLQRLCD